MSKKKRNKRYKGSVDAARPIVTKVSAVKRNPLHQWWVDRQQYIKPALPIVGIVVVVIIIALGLVAVIWSR